MRAGGNQTAQEFFSRHPGASMSKDALTKYTSKAAQQYKKQLTERTKTMQESQSSNDDTEKELSLIDFSSTPTSPQKGTALSKEEEDFFSGWEKPEQPAAQRSSAQPNGVPKTKTNLSTASQSRQQKTRPMKLGARKHADFNFEEAQAREKLADSMAEEVSQTAVSQPAHISSRLAYADSYSSNENHTSAHVNENASAKNGSVDPPKRLGGFGFVPDANAVANAPPFSSRITGMGSAPEVDEPTGARDRFTNAKSISSDQYFQRGQYDPTLSAENNARLAQFQGSNSISSDQYFGRPEFTESSRKASAEFDATEATRKFLRGAVRGASKLQRMLSDMERRY